MFIAMNRFRVAKGSEAAFEHVWMSRDSHSRRCQASWSFTFSRALKLRIRHFMLPTRCGKTVPSLKHGLNLKLSVQHIVGQETTSHCIWITRSSRGLKFARR